ncbi:MAG: lytic transglycosylase domain-containing protein, partial [Draconibacterium sp.]
MTKNKKWWKVSVPVLLVGNVVLILMLLGSARPEEPRDASKREVRFEAVEIPEKASFAGESLPLDRFYVKEALDRELLSNAYFHSQTIRFIKLAPRYFPIIEPILKEEGIHDDFKYLAVAESGFNPRAISPASAAGFWQFMKGTAGDYGLEVNSEVDERYHIEKSTRAACDYLKDAYEKFGSWTLVAASYNRGMTGVQR